MSELELRGSRERRERSRTYMVACEDGRRALIQSQTDLEVTTPILPGNHIMIQVQENVLLSAFSNYKIGGPAKFFCKAKSEDEVKDAAAWAKQKNVAVFVLGGGTNLLIPENGFDGLVIRPEMDFLEVNEESISAGAGVSIAQLLNCTIVNSLSGLEWAGGLPGDFGGAIRGNAGAFGGEIKDSIGSVRSFDMEAMRFVERTGSECVFGYRASIFKERPREVVLSALLRMQHGDAAKIRATIEEKIAYRNERQPLEYPNVGSIFKNVPLAKIHAAGGAEYKKAIKQGSLEFKGSRFSVKTDPFPVIPAAKLISESGLAGKTAGGAAISPKHPNFIVNEHHASAADVKKLIALAKDEVYKKFGLQLEEEVQIL